MRNKETNKYENKNDEVNNLSEETTEFMKKEAKKNSPLRYELLTKKILNIAITIFVTVAVFFAGYFTYYFSLDKDLRSLDFILNIYRKNYYEQENGSIMDALVEGLMDQYSSYYTAEEYKQIIKNSQGKRGGFGFSITKDLVIYSVSGNSPAEKNGLKKDDKVIAYKMNDQNDFIEAKNTDDFVNFLKNANENQVINLKVNRGENEKIINIERREYDETYVYYTDSIGSYSFSSDENGVLQYAKQSEKQVDVNGDWGYIKLTSFDGLRDGIYGSAGQFQIALNSFKTNGKTKLLIDLRGNGGGYLSILSEMASHLCLDPDNENGNFICQTATYGNGRIQKFFSPKSDYKNYNFQKIVFLADSGSASASEALMGAVLDYDKKLGKNIVNVIVEPTLINEEKIYRTYGKGIMQTTFENGKTGEALKLTTAKINWPVSGISIHGTGLNSSLDDRILNSVGDSISYAQTL